jgi:hypothetical protein
MSDTHTSEQSTPHQELLARFDILETRFNAFERLVYTTVFSSLASLLAVIGTWLKQ